MSFILSVIGLVILFYISNMIYYTIRIFTDSAVDSKNTNVHQSDVPAQLDLPFDTVQKPSKDQNNVDDFTTVYLTEDIELTNGDIAYLEKALERDIGVGHNFVNIYTKDPEIIQAFIDLVGQHYIEEISYGSDSTNIA